MTFENKVKAACVVAGISVTELGRRLGMSQQNISQRLKTGKFKQEEIQQIASILGCEYHSLFVFPDGTTIE